MSKNIPITARVNKGLFNNKNGKVTEPLLSVGPAGVSGNNQTRPIPAPAKMTSPLKKSEAAGTKILNEGQPKNASKVKTVTKGATTTMPGGTETKQVTVKKAYVGAANDACSSVYIAKHGRSACDKYKKLPASKKGNTETKTITTQTPSTTTTAPDKEEEVTLMTMNKGTGMASWERRSNDRSVINTARKTKRAEIDLAKAQADKSGLVGKDKREFVSKAKKEAKFNQAKAKVAGLTGSREAAILQNQQSKKAGEEIQGTYVNPEKEQVLSATSATQGNLGDRLAQKAAITGNIGNAETNNPLATKPTGTIEKAGTAATTPPAEVKKLEKPAVEADPNDVPTIGKRINSFFNKKSPLKMKYFK